jgi:hypothetical protein
VLAAAVAGWAAAPAAAADARFERVMVLPSADRVSVVFELTGEPANVTTRRVSSAVLEINAGPVVTPVDPGTYVAPQGVRFVSKVAIQGAAAGEGSLLQARITLAERSNSRVRVVGRRVYVDLTPTETPEAPHAASPERPAPRPPAPAAAAPRGARAAQPVTRAQAEPAVPVTVVAEGEPAYEQAVRPAIERLEQLRPFLLSATSQPTAPVLAAVGSTLTDIDQSLRGVDVPEDARQSHALLTSSIALAKKAVDPAFSGDRGAQVQQALALLTQARNQ